MDDTVEWNRRAVVLGAILTCPLFLLLIWLAVAVNPPVPVALATPTPFPPTSVATSPPPMFYPTWRWPVRPTCHPTHTTLRGVTVASEPIIVALDDQAGRAFVAYTDNGAVSAIDLRCETVLATRAVGNYGSMALAVDLRAHRVFMTSEAGSTVDTVGSEYYHTYNGSISSLDERTGASIFPYEVPVGEVPIAIGVDTRTEHVFVLNKYNTCCWPYAGPGGHDTHSSGTVMMFDARRGTLLYTEDVGLAATGLAVDERTSRVFVPTAGTASGDDIGVYVLDTHSGAIVNSVALDSPPAALAVDTPIDRVFVSTQRDVSILDAHSGNIVRTIVTGRGAQGLAVDTRRNHVFVLTAAGVTMLDGRHGTVLHRVVLAGGARLIAVDERTGRAFVANERRKTVTVLNRAGAVVCTLPLHGRPQALVVAPHSERVLVGYDKGRILRIFDTKVCST